MIVEFAAIFIVFAMLLWGLITYGVIFAAQQQITHATSDAARSTVGLYPDEGAARDRIDGIFETQFGPDGEHTWLRHEGFSYTVEYETCQSPSGGEARECTIVRATYDWDGHPIVPEILSVATPNTLSSQAVVQWD